MKPRRWFVSPSLLSWKMELASGRYSGPLFLFVDPWMPVSTYATFVCVSNNGHKYELYGNSCIYCGKKRVRYDN